MRFYVPRFLGATAELSNPDLRSGPPHTAPRRSLFAVSTILSRNIICQRGRVRGGLAMAMMWGCGVMPGGVSVAKQLGQSKATAATVSKSKKPRVAAATRKFGERADGLLASVPASK